MYGLFAYYTSLFGREKRNETKVATGKMCVFWLNEYARARRMWETNILLVSPLVCVFVSVNLWFSPHSIFHCLFYYFVAGVRSWVCDAIAITSLNMCSTHSHPYRRAFVHCHSAQSTQPKEMEFRSHFFLVCEIVYCNGKSRNTHVSRITAVEHKAKAMPTANCQETNTFIQRRRLFATIKIKLFLFATQLRSILAHMRIGRARKLPIFCLSRSRTNNQCVKEMWAHSVADRH